MSESAFFKVKSTKRSNPEARTTLDAIHNKKIQTMMEEKQQVQKYKEEIEAFQTKINATTSDMESWRWEREIDGLKKKIKSIEDGSELMDYYLRTGDILYHYYDIQEQIQRGTATFANNKAKPGSILAILEEVAQEEGNESGNAVIDPSVGGSEKKSFQRNQLLNDYLQMEDPAMGRNSVEEYDDPWTICERCSSEMNM